jgi:hypothetical protein
MPDANETLVRETFSVMYTNSSSPLRYSFSPYVFPIVLLAGELNQLTFSRVVLISPLMLDACFLAEEKMKATTLPGLYDPPAV